MKENKSYKIKYVKSVIEKDINCFSETIKSTLKKAIDTKLTTNPIIFGKTLNYNLKGYRRLRVGNYRVIYKIQDDIVIIVAIKHRRDAYN